MKCSIGNVNLGTWCRAIHSLTQVGDDEIYFDFNDKIITVSTTNSSQTTFTTFLFFKNFFNSYQMTSDEPEKVAFPAKIILKPYRTQKMAKSYVTSEIIYVPGEDFIRITSEGKSRISTTYKLGASVSSENIEYDCDPYSRPHCLRIDAKTLSSCLSSFSHVKGLAEINFKIQGSKVTLRNCFSDISRKDGSVVTEFIFSSYDFIDFEVPSNFTFDVSFGFREFKTLTNFAEQLKLPIAMHFQDAEEPIIMVVKSDTFEARLCMATSVKDPFVDTPNVGVSQSQCSGSRGRISNVASENPSGTATRSISQEVNRQQTNNGSSGAGNEISNPQQRPSKRLRRTEEPQPVPPPDANVTSSPYSPQSQLHSFTEMTNSPNTAPAPVSIAREVERIEVRTKSKAYRAIQRVMSAPRMTEEEYLSTIPGHDIVLCPDSDDEN